MTEFFARLADRLMLEPDDVITAYRDFFAPYIPAFTSREDFLSCVDYTATLCLYLAGPDAGVSIDRIREIAEGI